MLKKGILLLFFLGFSWFFLAVEVMAADLILTGSIDSTGLVPPFYYSVDDIYTEGDCYVENGNTAILNTANTITLGPGFHVVLGGIFVAHEDFDNDGLLDGWEYAQFGNLLKGPNDDPDLDGITLYWEFLLGLSGVNPEFDSDSDGLPDWYEVAEYQNLDHDIDSGECDCD